MNFLTPKQLSNSAISSLLTAVIIALLLHFRPPLYNPTKPEPFDVDMIELKIRTAPKNADILLLGDSITNRWQYRSYMLDKLGLAANIGVEGSRTANLLWLVNSRMLRAFHPKEIVVRIGANDLYPKPSFFQRRSASQQDVDAGIAMIQSSLKKQFPDARILVFPPTDTAPGMTCNDGIHLSDQGYATWATALTQATPVTAP